MADRSEKTSADNEEAILQQQRYINWLFDNHTGRPLHCTVLEDSVSRQVLIGMEIPASVNEQTTCTLFIDGRVISKITSDRGAPLNRNPWLASSIDPVRAIDEYVLAVSSQPNITILSSERSEDSDRLIANLLIAGTMAIEFVQAQNSREAERKLQAELAESQRLVSMARATANVGALFDKVVETFGQSTSQPEDN